jgi:Na+/H+ antiporter NhaD/arsenite permease-like protein
MTASHPDPRNHHRPITRALGLLALACAPAVVAASGAVAGAPPRVDGPQLFGIPVDFILFGLTLCGVALFHKYTLQVAVTGLLIITLFKVGFSPFASGPGVGGLVAHAANEWVILVNLFLLLTGFAFLSRHFEKSHVPALLPRYLPGDWKGAFAMLVIVFVLSSFLDNIAAAMIGGAMAHTLFRGKVSVGYLAAIVAASNAGGSGSVVGDTTTTMMWIDKVSPLAVVEAFIAAGVALVIFGIPAAIQQNKYSPIIKETEDAPKVDWARVGIVAIVLVSAIFINVAVNVRYAEYSDLFPWIGAAVWGALLLTASWRRPDWGLLREAAPGSFFLLSLVMAASMMPVEKLPAASWPTTLGLGFLSAVFDNIPLTKLALQQGGYDWGFLAYAVGFGGSMIWFGSSAGVAITTLYPEARSVARWVKEGWYVPIAYVAGFLVLLVTLGWHPTPKGSRPPPTPAAITAPVR